MVTIQIVHRNLRRRDIALSIRLTVAFAKTWPQFSSKISAIIRRACGCKCQYFLQVLCKMITAKNAVCPCIMIRNIITFISYHPQNCGFSLIKSDYKRQLIAEMTVICFRANAEAMQHNDHAYIVLYLTTSADQLN